MNNVIKDIELKVLLLEDSVRDAELIREILTGAGYILDFTHVENQSAFTYVLQADNLDIILSDFSMPGFDAFGALQIRNEICPEVPFICVSGSIGEETAIELLKLGAVDYVLKDRPDRLPFAVKRALEDAKEKVAHQKAAKDLYESENRFKQVAEDAQEWIWEIDKDGIYTYASPVCLSLLGYSVNEIVGKKHFFDFFVPDKKEEMKKSAFEVFSRKESFRNFENQNIHKDGHVLILSTSGSPILDDKENLIGYRGVDSDITERKRTLEELIAAKEKAETSDRLKTAFINNISHEIRTPLNGILGFGQLITGSDVTPEDRSEMFKHMNTASNRLMNTVNDYLDMAMIVSGTMDLYIKDFLLNSIFDESVKKTERLCSDKKIEFKFQVPEKSENIVLKSDKGFVVKIFEILLNNAVKFTENGRIICGYRIIDGYIEFFVNDTGKGIASDKLDMIFNMFSQEVTEITRGYEGSGLGLSIARGLISLLGGTIHVNSEKGKGSEFTFKFPYVESVSVLKPEVKISSEPISRADPLILIAEDEDSNIMYIERVLKMLGYRYLHAINGKEAVELCRQNPDISLVLMDIKMPVMNGLEATKLIREFNPKLPIIATTAYKQIGLEWRFLASGFSGYLGKPILKEDLEIFIKRFI